MIISEALGLIFIKTRKTAGTSVQETLAAFCGPNDIIAGGRRAGAHRNVWFSPAGYYLTRATCALTGRCFWPTAGHTSKHATIAQVIAVLGDRHASYFKAAFVRNPFDLVVSRYWWDRAKGRHCIADFNDWVEDHYAVTGNWMLDSLHSFTHVDGECRVDFIGRYETLTQDFESLCARVGIVPCPPLPNKKSGHRPQRDYRTLYSDTSRAIVTELFAEDLELFGYRFER